MPDMDGYTFLGKIRTLGLGNGGEIPVIALTAFASGSDIVRIRQSGFQLHIPKPVNAEELVRAIAEWIRSQR